MAVIMDLAGHINVILAYVIIPFKGRLVLQYGGLVLSRGGCTGKRHECLRSINIFSFLVLMILLSMFVARL
jgi:hypothetical protein